MMSIPKGGLTLKNFFRNPERVLLAAVLLVCALCAVLAAALANFSPAVYETDIALLNARTDQLRSGTLAARVETEKELALLRSDLRRSGEEAAALADRVELLRAETEEKEARLRELAPLAALHDGPQAAVEEARRRYALKIRELEDRILSGDREVRICYWTLDDGPAGNTKAFLDAFDELGGHVHVTFFTSNGANHSEDEEEMLRREMRSGHSVQNHSFSHDYWPNGKVYRSVDSFRDQVCRQEDWLYEVTGFRPGVFRFPGGSKTGLYYLPEAEQALADMGYRWADWNCILRDAGEIRFASAEQIATAMEQIPEEKIAVVLGHDWNLGTMYAITALIPRLQDLGYVFLPLFPESAMMGLEATR